MKHRVVVVGSGVASLEAVLALRDLAGDRIEIELITPDDAFHLAALTVAEPFGGGKPREVGIADFCDRQGVELRTDALAAVWSDRHRVLTAAADDVFYDSLLLGMGTRREEAVPGAITFGGAPDVGRLEELLRGMERGAGDEIAFALPAGVRWSLPLFELALLTSKWIRDRITLPVPLRIVTADPEPLAVFGVEPGRRIADLLRDSVIELDTGVEPLRFEDGTLHCAGGRSFEADAVVALPRRTVPDLPGVPQGRDGMIDCDPEMRVGGLDSVWVAGDASWFPIKQGGIAAQQAEVAASGIARAAGAAVDQLDFRPVIRAALLTGDEPRFLHVDLSAGGRGELSTSPLWWPPIKVAGPRLAPYLAREWGGDEGDVLVPSADLDLPDHHDEAEHRAALRLSLDFADLDARAGELDQALRWLEVAERLNVTLPPDYVERRSRWRSEVDSAGSS